MTRVKTMGRRHFLLGAGGFSLAIPLLPSLLPREAQAGPTTQRRLIALATDHGGIYPANMYPADPSTMTKKTLRGVSGKIPAHVARWGDLSATVQGTDRVLSNVLRAPTSAWPASLVKKMNVMTGFDVPFYIGHNRSSFIGNYADTDQGKTIKTLHLPTIDQLIASHKGFNLANPIKKSIAYGYGNPYEVKGGLVSRVPHERSAPTLWREVFGGATSSTPSRKLVVDRVHEHFKRVSTGVFGDATRLSSLDKKRLGNHMERLLELERKLGTKVNCRKVATPAWPAGTIPRLKLFVDLAVAAITCRACNVVVLGGGGRGMTEDVGWTNWHQEVAHKGCGRTTSGDAKLQAIAYRAQRRFFTEVFLPLARKLDVAEGGGATYLDNTLMYWSMESGDITHENFSVPVITAGGADGYFHTGRFIDYRNRDNTNIAKTGAAFRRPGLLMNQFLANVMMGMGVSPSDWRAELLRVQPKEFADTKRRGYGLYLSRGKQWGTDYTGLAHPEHLYHTADNKLAGWVKGA